MIGEADEPVPGMHPFGGQGTQESQQEAGTMRLVVREAERLDHGVRERGAQQRPAAVPPPLVPGERTHAHAVQLVRQAQTVEDA